MTLDSRLKRIVAAQPYPLLFATISGTHLYGLRLPKPATQRLLRELQAAHDASQLPELPSDETRAALNDMLVRVRLGDRANRAASTELG